MKNKFEVGKKYKAKNYLESGYRFPEGKYKIEKINEGFPTNLLKNKTELKANIKKWLEGFEDGKEEYDKLFNGNWYYLKFPEGDHYEWVPENVMEDAFDLK